MQDMEAAPPPEQPLELRTLGTLGLYRGAAEPSLLPAGKPMALLAYLCAMPERSAGREHLLDLLWADVEAAIARHSLRQTTYYIRRRLGPGVLAARGDDLVLAGPVACDRTRFLEAIEAGRREDAVRLYQGEFLPHFAVPGGSGFEHWASAERRRLQLLFVNAAEPLVRQRLSQGSFRAARELAARVRDADTDEESGWRLLIEACLAQGDRVSALAEAARLDEHLRDETRVPEPATAAILRRARAGPNDDAAAAESDRPALLADLARRRGPCIRWWLASCSWLLPDSRTASWMRGPWSAGGGRRAGVVARGCRRAAAAGTAGAVRARASRRVSVIRPAA